MQVSIWPETLRDQDEVQRSVDELYGEPRCSEDLHRLALNKRKHIAWLKRGLEGLGEGYTSLDASTPWLCFWLLHSLDLLDHPLDDALQARAIHTLRQCQHPQGGYGGGPGQLPHLACTFAAISALAVIGSEAAFASIDQEGLLRFLRTMRRSNGSFSVHEGGESDVRGAYCAVVAATLTGLATPSLFQDTAAFIKACQSYEGGFGAVPHAEAHAGYTYCAVAALLLLDDVEGVDLCGLHRFAQLSQCPDAGGFRGRTHKLVDGCYSFWSGALFPMLRKAWPASYFDSLALQKYILVACQDLHSPGGLCDKPGKKPDYYHTCYCLSGLSIAQRETPDFPDAPLAETEVGGGLQEDPSLLEEGIVLGDAGNLLPAVEPEYNLRSHQVAAIKRHFTAHISASPP